MDRMPQPSSIDAMAALPPELKAPWWLPSGHAQTIYASLAAPGTADAPQAQRSTWITPDEDQILVNEWPAPEAAPTLVLFHGLEGDSDSHYAKAFAKACAQRGWRMVLPHFRGCGGMVNLKPRAYHSGDHAEIDWVLRRIQQHSPASPLHAVGISLGGNALLRWAQEQGELAHQVVRSVTSLCAPLDLVVSGLGLEQGLNRIFYTPRFLRTMKPKARQMWARFPGLFDLKATDRARSLREFDDAFTAPVHGFKGVMDYWQRASAKPHLRRLALPSLIVNPLNDPFVPLACLPKPSEVNACTSLWQPPQGGHLGFVQGAFPGQLQTWPSLVMAWMSSQETRYG